MHDLLELYAQPFQPGEPVICLDEKSSSCSRILVHRCPSAPECPYGRITNTSAAAPAICSWQWNRKADGGQSWSPIAAPSSTSWPSFSICSTRSTQRRIVSIWSWIISTPTFVNASKKCSGSRRRQHSCVALSFTTPRNTPAS